MNGLKEVLRNLVILTLFVGLCLFVAQMTPNMNVHAYHSADFYGLKGFDLDKKNNSAQDHSKFWGVPSL